MSFPDINDLSTAFTLCICPEQGCNRQCSVCQSPTWREQGCVRVQFEELPYRPTRYVSAMDGDRVVATAPVNPDGTATFTLADMGRMAAFGTPAGVPKQQRPADSPEELVERAIDWMEEQGTPLLPWQAVAFRAIMLHDGKRP
jgi:pyruvate-formate lyase-activating enzyme